MTDTLAMLLSQAEAPAVDPLEAALASAKAPALEAVGEEESAPLSAGQKGKAALRTENQALKANLERQTKFVRGLAGVAAVSTVLAIGMFFWSRAQEPRSLERAFRIIAYREVRALEANAIVLDDYSKKMGGIIEDVKAMPGITEGERAIRLKALVAAKSQSDQLRDGFLKQAQESQKANGTGGSFSYTDPFLKRPVDWDEELGGKVDLDKLRAEIAKASSLDAAMEEMRHTMLNPTPIQDQLAQEAKDQRAPMVGPGGVIPPTQQGQGGPLQLPGVALPPGPAPATLPH